MKIKFSIFLVLTLFTARLSVCQELITGTVRELATNEPISFCTIRLIKNPAGTTSDAAGKFKLLLPALNNQADKQLVISSIGFQSDTIAILPGKTDYTVFLTLATHTLTDVIVTGLARGVAVNENPLAVQSISSKKMETTVESNIIDVLMKNSPGLTTLKTGPNISKPFIRGLGYNRVLTLYDGVRQEGQQWGDEHGIEVDAYAIEKAEVIKGPSSIMFGSDALAGVISLFPYLPKEKDGLVHGKITSEYQSNNGLIGNGLRVDFSNQHWLWAVRASQRMAKNYANRVDGRVYNTGFNEKNFSALLGYSGAKGFSRLNFTWYDNGQGIPDGSRDSLTRKFTKQTKEAALDDIANRTLVSNQELASYQLSPLHQRITHLRVYVNNHYLFGKGDADALIAYSQSVRQEFTHPTAPTQPGLNVRLSTFNYRLVYNAPNLHGVESSYGVNGMLQHNQTQEATDFPIPNYVLNDASVFAHFHWKYKQWSVISGVSTDLRQLNTDDLYVSRNQASGFTQQVAKTAPNATLLHPSLTQTFSGFSLNVGTAYQLNDHLSAKINFAKGYRAPSIAEIASNGLDPGAHIVYIGNKNFLPETNVQLDVGLQATFPNASASLSLFDNQVANFIHLSQVVDAQGNPIEILLGNKTFQYQQAAAHLYGLEATVTINPEHSKGLVWNNQLSVVYGNNTKKEFENTGKQGEYLPFIPPIKITSGLAQEIKVKSTWLQTIQLNAEAEYSAAQNRFLALYRTETATAGYSLLNLGARAEIRYSKRQLCTAQFQINNVFDVAYQSNLSRLKYFEYYAQSPTGRSGIYNMGRNVCVKITMAF